MSEKRIVLRVVLLVALILALVGCQREPVEQVATQALPYLRIDKALVRHQMTNLGFLTVGDGSPTTAQTEGSESVYVEGTFEVDGAADLDGALDVDTTGAISLDADLASNFSTSVGDLTIDAETGSVKIIGSEAAADSIHLDANDTVTSGIDIDLGSVSGMAIDGGLVDIGSGTCGTADGDNDVCIAADLEVDNTLDVDGDIDLDGDGFDVNITAGFSIDADLASNISIAAGDLTVDAETGSVNIIGSEASAAAIYLDANDTVTTGVDIDTGTTSGLRIDGGPFSVDGTGAFNVNTAAGDIAVEAETGSVTLKGDEGAGDAIHLDADETALGGVTIAANTGGVDVNLTAAGPFAIDGDMLIVGNAGADGGTADGDNDMLVTGDVEIDTGLYVADVVTVTSSSAVFGADGAGLDVYFYSDTAGDYGLWDTGGERFVIIGTDGSYALDVQDGDINLADNLKNDSGDLTIADDAVITGTLDVQDDVIDSVGDFTIIDNVIITGTLNAQGAVDFDSTLDMSDQIISNIGNATTDFDGSGGLRLAGTLTVDSTSDFKDDIADSVGDLTIADNAVITGTLDVQGGDITMQNDETLSNSTNGVVQIGGFLALTEGTVQVMTYGCTLTAVGSFQPITSTAVITNVIIADGALAGQIVVISNENAGDDITILEAGSNLQAGGDVTLTGGAKDLLTLLWDGAEWIRLAFFDN